MSRWRCRRYRSRLVDCVAGTLSGPEQQWLERHLAHCPTCSRDLAALHDVPVILQRSAVPDPGKEFWLHQRREIGRAIRNLPEPRSAGRFTAWLKNLYHWPWPAAFSATAAVLVALTVYRFAERPPAPQPTPINPALAALDTGSLAMLHDFMEAVAPNEGEIQGEAPDDETLLAALPIDDLVGVNALPAAPQTGDLNEEELEGIGDLVGGIG